jgi:hypothetical protein
MFHVKLLPYSARLVRRSWSPTDGRCSVSGSGGLRGGTDAGARWTVREPMVGRTLPSWVPVGVLGFSLWRIGSWRSGRVAAVTGRPDEAPRACASGAGMDAGSGEVDGLTGVVGLVCWPGSVGSRGGSAATSRPVGAGGAAGPVELAGSAALAGAPESGGSAGLALSAGSVASVELAGWAALVRSAGVAGPGRRHGSTEPAAVMVGSAGRPSGGPGWLDPVSGLAPGAGVDRWGALVGGGDADWTDAPTWHPESTNRSGQYVEPSMTAGELSPPGRAVPARAGELRPRGELAVVHGAEGSVGTEDPAGRDDGCSGTDQASPAFWYLLTQHRSARQGWPSIRRWTPSRRPRLARQGVVGAPSPHRGRASPLLPAAALSHEFALRVRAPRCVLLSRGGVLPVADDVSTPSSTRLGARRQREVSRRSLEVRQCAMCRNWAAT